MGFGLWIASPLLLFAKTDVPATYSDCGIQTRSKLADFNITEDEINRRCPYSTGLTIDTSNARDSELTDSHSTCRKVFLASQVAAKRIDDDAVKFCLESDFLQKAQKDCGYTGTYVRGLDDAIFFAKHVTQKRCLMEPAAYQIKTAEFERNKQARLDKIKIGIEEIEAENKKAEEEAIAARQRLIAERNDPIQDIPATPLRLPEPRADGTPGGKNAAERPFSLVEEGTIVRRVGAPTPGTRTSPPDPATVTPASPANPFASGPSPHSFAEVPVNRSAPAERNIRGASTMVPAASLTRIQTIDRLHKVSQEYKNARERAKKLKAVVGDLKRESVSREVGYRKGALSLAERADSLSSDGSNDNFMSIFAANAARLTALYKQYPDLVKKSDIPMAPAARSPVAAVKSSLVDAPLALGSASENQIGVGKLKGEVTTSAISDEKPGRAPSVGSTVGKSRQGSNYKGLKNALQNELREAGAAGNPDLGGTDDASSANIVGDAGRTVASILTETPDPDAKPTAGGIHNSSGSSSRFEALGHEKTFSISGADTEDEVKRMVAQLEDHSMASKGVLESESEGLFDRVRSAHLRFVKRALAEGESPAQALAYRASGR